MSSQDIIGTKHLRIIQNGHADHAKRIAKVERRIARIPQKSALPANPYDGQEVIIEATEGINWRFRYNLASSSSYKWEFIGGVPWYKEVTTQQTTSSASYVALATALEHTTPFAGDYLVEQGAQVYQSTSGGFAYVSHSVGGAATTAADADGMFTQQATVAGSDGAYMFRRTRHDGVAASALIAEAARAGGGATANVQRRSLSITPIRVA